jgi:hypothetical protein
MHTYCKGISDLLDYGKVFRKFRAQSSWRLPKTGCLQVRGNENMRRNFLFRSRFSGASALAQRKPSGGGGNPL